MGEGVEEGALACVGVADEGCDGEAGAMATIALELSGAFDAVQLAVESLDAAADETPVCLNLGLAGAAGADAAAESFKVGPLTGEAGKEVLVLGEFDLELALAGAGVAGEYVQDESGAVDDLFAEFPLEVALLGGCEFVVEDDKVSFKLALEVAELLQFALTDVEGGAFFQPLGYGGHHLRAGGVGELSEFVEGSLQASGAAGVLELGAYEEGAFGVAEGP